MSERNQEQQNAGELARQAPTNPPRAHEETLKRVHGFDGDNYANPASNNADSTGKRGSRAAASEDEPTFHGKPLGAYDRYQTEEQLTALDGIGEVTAKEIMRARAKRDRAK